MHDKLLLKDLRWQSGGLIALYTITGALAVLIGGTICERAGLYLVGTGGFLLGMSLEKFATRQIRRVARHLAEQQKQLLQ
ncbi:hypothetical protein EBU99_00990 [bacterium]|nr:hypothetical protein [bacterium]